MGNKVPGGLKRSSIQKPDPPIATAAGNPSPIGRTTQTGDAGGAATGLQSTVFRIPQPDPPPAGFHFFRALLQRSPFRKSLIPDPEFFGFPAEGHGTLIGRDFKNQVSCENLRHAAAFEKPFSLWIQAPGSTACQPWSILNPDFIPPNLKCSVLSADPNQHPTVGCSKNFIQRTLLLRSQQDPGFAGVPEVSVGQRVRVPPGAIEGDPPRFAHPTDAAS